MALKVTLEDTLCVPNHKMLKHVEPTGIVSTCFTILWDLVIRAGVVKGEFQISVSEWVILQKH